ncbi:hypothetical protein BH23CYA1_BH23CYA1_11360 [soil metagenome]
MNYYNEIDPFAAWWLKELIRAGLIPAGDVDERSIEDVLPTDLKSYRQCHFFAGVGGWPLALQLAGWPEDCPVWTGSVPCKPFSTAGKRAGFDDQRHLWPAFFWLIQQCCPPVIFGEQVSTKLALKWWDLVASDLEGANYATVAADLPSASVGSPHRRDRLFWVGHSNRAGWQRQRPAQSERRQHSPVSSWSGQSDVEYASGQRRKKPEAITPGAEESTQEKVRIGTTGANCAPNHWGKCEWIDCLDGKRRPIKPGIRLLVDGFPGRVAALRCFGNAIVPQVAAEFIQSYREVVFV